ncbi:MAG: hypothetical protein RL572_480, partial [Pseudomonadota bacterium]
MLQMTKRGKLRLMIHSCLTVSLAAPLFALAQAPAPQVREVEEVLVTGSRIRRDTDIQNIAVIEIDAQQMALRGYVNTIESLEQLPFVSVGVNNQGNNTQFGDNNAFVNLLNLGSQRTLTLVDGRRFVSSNQGTVFVPGNATGAQVDLTIINPSLIRGTQVQTVGSGAVYGPDAIAGVVNVELDRNFQGSEVIGQFGMTDEADGRQRRVSGAWGDDVLDGRGHLVVGLEYMELDAIYQGERRDWTNNIALVNNPFSVSGTDGVANTIYQEDMIANTIPVGGRLDLRQTNAGSTATFLFPRACISAQTVNAAACNTFTTRMGASPYDYMRGSPSVGLSALAFAGTFGLSSGWPTVPTAAGSSEANAGLTRTAVPLTFDDKGNLVPLSLGQILPPNVAPQSSGVNAGGFDTRHLNTIQAAQERTSLNALFSYELTDSVRYEGDFLYSTIDNSQRADNFGSNSPAGAFTAGNAGIPIYYEQNPFVTTATRNQINSLIAANPASPFTTIGGQPVFFLQRSLADITGSMPGDVTNMEGNVSTTLSTGHTLKQDFEFMDRDLYWEATLAYGQNESKNNAANDVLDVEFALAT